MDAWEGVLMEHGVFVWRVEPVQNLLSFDSMTEVLSVLRDDLGSEFTITFKPGHYAEQQRFTVLEHPWKDAVS